MDYAQNGTNNENEGIENRFPKEQMPKRSISSRIINFLLAWVPMMASISLQIICGIVVMLPIMLRELFKINMSDAEEVAEVIAKVTIDAAPMGVFFYHIVGILIFGLWYYLEFKKPRPKLLDSFKVLNGKSISAALLVGIGLCFFANAMVMVESFLMPKVVESYIDMAEIAGLGVNGFVIFAAVVMAPIGEEFVCRGLVLRYSEKVFSRFWMANCLQALTFGIMHMNWVQGSYAFVIGLVLGWLTKRYKSIIPAILIHFVVNFSTSTWVAYILQAMDSPLKKISESLLGPESLESSSNVIYLASGVILLVVSGVFVWAILRWVVKPEKQAA